MIKHSQIDNYIPIIDDFSIKTELVLAPLVTSFPDKITQIIDNLGIY